MFWRCHFYAVVIGAFYFTVASANSIDDRVNEVLTLHYNAYRDKEYFSGIALSIYIPKRGIRSYYIGRCGHDKNSKKIDSNTLFEIGSITKSFTSAILLQLEKEKKVDLNQNLKRLLPEYTKWSGISLASLLNMTSGIPNYTSSVAFNAEAYYDGGHVWTNQEIISYAYPPGNFSPPLMHGYNYNNTGYILTSMIIERVTKNSFKSEIESRLFKHAELSNTFYPVPTMPKEVANRLAHGYQYNPYGNVKTLGEDTSRNNLSSAGASGAIISNTVDIINWHKALMIDNNLLDAKQKAKLTQLVSTATGKPIDKTSKNDSSAYGLGVFQGFDKMLGRYWSYEGKMEGFRALYIYVPASGIIISAAFNSAVDEQNDRAELLVKNVYKIIEKY
ncbi:MAG: beta-lactamase family protein [Gammaproteobacteria bacterium]|nr:beta-lactamase family protein [Gammaproteobacteria bacterium]